MVSFKKFLLKYLLFFYIYFWVLVLVYEEKKDVILRTSLKEYVTILHGNISFLLNSSKLWGAIQPSDSRALLLSELNLTMGLGHWSEQKRSVLHLEGLTCSVTSRQDLVECRTQQISIGDVECFTCNLYFYYTFLKTEVWNQARFLPREWTPHLFPSGVSFCFSSLIPGYFSPQKLYLF